MHGYGPTPQQQTTSRPSPATLAAVRVILVAVTALSCGLLGWVAMLRLAIVTRRTRDWVLLAVVVVLNTGLFVFVMETPDDPDDMSDTQALLMMVWLVAVLVGVIAYYLYAEIRHYGPPPPHGASATVPPAPLPYQRHPAQHHQHQHHQQRPQPNPYTVQTPPPTPTPAPQRLDQVRAELDELSDYLRKENREGEGR
ncbi:hypothetical protein ACH4KN_19040 [Streptomyces sp. NPDC017546]|uniref:hypothetical protein n=1 Tax=unclassified Streptomyces TaxID=2593676 RepID=UPI0023616DFA|nr:hypothetical protein [Streptomyces sp. MMBL 11-1]